VLFGPHGRRYRHPSPALAAAIRRKRGVSSLQITFYENRPPETHAMPPGGFRLAIVNAHDLAAGEAARAALARALLTRTRGSAPGPRQGAPPLDPAGALRPQTPERFK
jgi:hypothetical protein